MSADMYKEILLVVDAVSNEKGIDKEIIHRRILSQPRVDRFSPY